MKKIVLSAFILLSVTAYSQVKDVLIPYKKGAHWGFSDSNGKVAIQPVYDSVTLYASTWSGNKLVKYSKVFLNKKVGVISDASKIIVPLLYTSIDIDYESDKMIVTAENGKKGVMTFVKTILPAEFESIKETRNNSYVVGKNGKIGLADANGQIVIPIAYDQMNYVSNDYHNYKWKVVNDKETKHVLTPVIEEEYSLNDVGMSSLIDAIRADEAALNTLKEKYRVIINREYDYAVIFIDDNGKYGFANLNSGNTVKAAFEKLDFLDQVCSDEKGCGFFLVFYENGKQGIIDETGAILVPAKYDRIYRDGPMNMVKSGEDYGVYFANTKKLVAPKYRHIDDLERFRGFSIVRVVPSNPKDWFYIGENGVEFRE